MPLKQHEVQEVVETLFDREGNFSDSETIVSHYESDSSYHSRVKRAINGLA